MKATLKANADPARELQRRTRKYNLRRKLKDNASLWGLALPGFLLMFLFHYVPMVGIIIAFKDFKPRLGIFDSPWNGLENFEFFFTSQDATRTIGNTVIYSLTFLIINQILGVTIALLLFHLKGQRRLKTYHTIMLIPRFLSIVIISFMVYGFLSPSQGLINHVITLFGGEKIDWYLEPKYWPAILIIVHIWQILGSGCLYYYAALVGIDSSLFEAASIDGAGTLQKCWHIAVPSLIPVMCMMLILGIGGLFGGDFGLFYNVPKNQGTLYETTDIISTYTYRALLSGALEKSAAVGLFQSVTGMILVLISNSIIRKVSPENSMF